MSPQKIALWKAIDSYFFKVFLLIFIIALVIGGLK